MEAYKAWVRANHRWFTQIEAAAQMLTYFVPDSYGKSELVLEAVSSLLGVVASINEHIVNTSPESPSSATGPPGSDRHSEGNAPDGGKDGDKPPPRSALGLLLVLIQQVEVLVELSAERMKGRDNKWGAISAVEGAKTLVRLAILAHSGGKMLIDGGTFMNTRIDPVQDGHLPAVLAQSPRSSEPTADPTWSSPTAPESDSISPVEPTRSTHWGSPTGRTLIPKKSRGSLSLSVDDSDSSQDDGKLSPIPEGGQASPSWQTHGWSSESRQGGPSQGDAATDPFSKDDHATGTRVPDGQPPSGWKGGAVAAGGSNGPSPRGVDASISPAMRALAGFHQQRAGQHAWLGAGGAHGTWGSAGASSQHAPAQTHADSPGCGSRELPSNDGKSGAAEERHGQGEASQGPDSKGSGNVPRHHAGNSERVNAGNPQSHSNLSPNSSLSTAPGLSAQASTGHERYSPLSGRPESRPSQPNRPPVLDPARSARRAVVLSEVLFALRPLVYAVSIRRHGHRSWRPWLASLAMTAASDALLAWANWRTSHPARSAARLPISAMARLADASMTAQERDELARRRVGWLLYLLRTPCFEAATDDVLRRVLRVLAPIPLAGGLASKGYDVLLGIQEYYFYTAGS